MDHTHILRAAAGHDNEPVTVTDTGYAVLRASGADAAEFLHNQLSNGVTGLGPHAVQRAAYCNPKGRVIALLRVLRHGDDVLLILPRERAEAVLKRLRMFVLRSRVQLEQDAGLALLGVAGAGAAAALETAGLPAPETGVAPGSVTVVAIGRRTPRFLLNGTPAELERLEPRLGAPAPGVAWHTAEILDGMPEIEGAAAEQFLPQSLNLDLPPLPAVDFGKGCYPGQEIVARLHYRGRPSRRLFLLRAPPGAALPAAGDSIRDGAGREAGHVVSAAAAGTAGAYLLGALRLEARAAKDLATAAGSPLEWPSAALQPNADAIEQPPAGDRPQGA